jgi:Zn-dependent peptidase ImmA (M78 family)
LERAAEALRHKLGIGPNEVPSAAAVIARLETVYGAEFIVQPDDVMGDKEAYATSNPPRIFVRHSICAAMMRDEPRARMTLAHEAMHLDLHPGAPKARVARGNITPGHIKPYQSAERQARVAAAAFLMPRNIVAESKSAEALRAHCRVSTQAAQIRFDQWQKQNTRKAELPFVRDHLNYLRSLTLQRPADAISNKQRQVRVMWDALEKIEGKDHNAYRMCSQGTYMVAWLEFERMTQCGWFIQDGKVVASIALDRG